MPTLRTEPATDTPASGLCATASASTSTPSPRPRGTPANPQKYRIEVRASPLDGLGAFAGEAIPARRKVGEIRGERIALREARRRSAGLARVFMIAVSATECVDASQSTDALRHANHSCAPNATYKLQQGRIAVYALRDIAPGEELTLDYGPTHHGGKLACRCGTARCRGWL